MDQVHVVRHKVLVEGRSQRAVARELGLSRMTQAIAVGLILRHSWHPDDLTCVLKRLGLKIRRRALCGETLTLVMMSVSGPI